MGRSTRARFNHQFPFRKGMFRSSSTGLLQEKALDALGAQSLPDQMAISPTLIGQPVVLRLLLQVNGLLHDKAPNEE